MNRFICIHGHFYQPPRENPWLEEIELQDSAYPYHDWNEKVSAECYAPNTASRILDGEGRIVDITSNYQKISFDFGPTLLSWMERKAPEVFQAVIAVGKDPGGRFSGHSPAMAQAYHHLIMPLANSRDKRTEVIWGIREFEHRFGRGPEGMWLPETAVDLECLEIMAELGIRFTILAPHQIGRTRKIGEEKWTEVSSGLDPRMPYLCRLGSGREINIFIYDGAISKDVAFSPLLDNGDAFANRLVQAFSESQDDQLVSIATDGETYGHHHPSGDMALAYGLYQIESKALARITVYGEYLERHPPDHEAEVVENTSWSCIHGIERWRSDCGCNTGTHHGWNQAWRGPLLGAMYWLRDALIPIYEGESRSLLRDPWQARDDYIYLILDRSAQNVERFLSDHAAKVLSPEEKVRALKLLEMQRHALLMFTSCGWFFDEISGLESTQVLKYASRAMQLVRELCGIDLEPEYVGILGQARSNLPEFGTGSGVYEVLVKPAALDLSRVAAHYAISSLFSEYSQIAGVFSYMVERLGYELSEAGAQKLAVGKARIRSNLTWEESIFGFAVVFFEGHYINGGVQRFAGDEQHLAMQREVLEAFSRADIPEVVRLMDKHFGDHNYGMWHLFRDAQRKIFGQILEPHLKEIDASFKQIYDRHYPIMQEMRALNVPIPDVLETVRKVILNSDLRESLQSADIVRLQKLFDEFQKGAVELDAALSLIAGRTLEMQMEELRTRPEDTELLQKIDSLAKVLEQLHLQANLWRSQNMLFAISREHLGEMKARAERGDDGARKWVEAFHNLESYMHVRTD